MTPLEYRRLADWCRLTGGLVTMDDSGVYAQDRAIYGVRLCLDGFGSVSADDAIADGPLGNSVNPLAALDAKVAAQTTVRS